MYTILLFVILACISCHHPNHATATPQLRIPQQTTYFRNADFDMFSTSRLSPTLFNNANYSDPDSPPFAAVPCGSVNRTEIYRPYDVEITVPLPVSSPTTSCESEPSPTASGKPQKRTYNERWSNEETEILITLWKENYDGLKNSHRSRGYAL